MAFSHILITRPREEAQELADQLGSGFGEPIILPAYEFHQTKLFTDQFREIETKYFLLLMDLYPFSLPILF